MVLYQSIKVTRLSQTSFANWSKFIVKGSVFLTDGLVIGGPIMFSPVDTTHGAWKISSEATSIINPLGWHGLTTGSYNIHNAVPS